MNRGDVAHRDLDPAEAPVETRMGNEALLKWARRFHRAVSLTDADHSDLRSLHGMIGRATLVAFGEGLHGGAEPLAFRNRLFQFLVKEMGFTAIAIESGLVASYAAADFVAGGEGDSQRVAADAITSGLGGFPQQAQLLDWMRDYNRVQEKGRKIEFFGIDVESDLSVSGSPLGYALKFLEEVDSAFSADLRRRLGRSLQYLKIDRLVDRSDHYARLPQAERDTVTAVINDMINHLQVNEGAFAGATTERRYSLACRAAVGAWQGDQYLRQFPIGWTPNDPPVLGAVAVADRAKADNLDWVLGQQGVDGRVLVFAHLGHLSKSPVSIHLGPLGEMPLPPMLGERLGRKFGSKLVTIGHLLARDATKFFPARPEAARDSSEGVLADVGADAFLLDIRPAPEVVRRRLQPVHGLYGQLPLHSLSLADGVDILFFTRMIMSAMD